MKHTHLDVLDFLDELSALEEKFGLQVVGDYNQPIFLINEMGEIIVEINDDIVDIYI